jgi:hypothetical protein
MAGRLQSEQVADISPECPADIIGICILAHAYAQCRSNKRCYGASGEDKASSSLETTDGDARCRSRMT